VPESTAKKLTGVENMAYLAVIAVIFGAECIIKTIVEHFVPLGEKKSICKERVFLTKYHNRGAALNFMEKRPGWVTACSVFLSLICTIIFVLTFTKSGGNGLKLSLALLLGGAYSNTYDRLSRKYVVDYVGVHHKKKKNDIIYNISDFCIIIGALMATLYGVQS